MLPKDRIIVALDVASLEAVGDLVEELSPHVGLFKIGLELITAVGGPYAIQAVHAKDGRVMYDAKFYDIPKTMAGAVRQAAAWGVEMFTVHASNHFAALEAAVREKGEAKMLGVTVLTSMKEQDCEDTFSRAPMNAVEVFARRAVRAGADGIVCSPEEAGLIARLGVGGAKPFSVCPGIRPPWVTDPDDQSRVMTPTEAKRAGADYYVVGRPILEARKYGLTRVEAAIRIAEEIASA
jgi:orotidine-5'-phosphate decarboxylase